MKHVSVNLFTLENNNKTDKRKMLQSYSIVQLNCDDIRNNSSLWFWMGCDYEKKEELQFGNAPYDNHAFFFFA